MAFKADYIANLISSQKSFNFENLKETDDGEDNNEGRGDEKERDKDE